jgi:hypothetical protein
MTPQQKQAMMSALIGQVGSMGQPMQQSGGPVSRLSLLAKVLQGYQQGQYIKGLQAQKPIAPVGTTQAQQTPPLMSGTQDGNQGDPQTYNPNAGAVPQIAQQPSSGAMDAGAGMPGAGGFGGGAMDMSAAGGAGDIANSLSDSDIMAMIGQA